MDGDKYNILHQVLEDLFAPCNSIPLPSLNKTYETLDESYSGLENPSYKQLFQSVGWSYRVHRTLVLASSKLYIWMMLICRVGGKETHYPLRQKNDLSDVG